MFKSKDSLYWGIMKIESFFETITSTLTYVCYFEGQPEALIVDSVWDYNPASGKLSDPSYQKLKAFLKEKKLKPIANLETHVHADHVTAAQLLKTDWPEIPTIIGKRIGEVQKLFKEIFQFGDWMKTDGSQFQHLMGDGDHIEIGPFSIKATSAPGHTPVCTIYNVNGSLFLGDVLFMPDFGTGRCDFPKGSATEMYHSVHEKLYSMGDDLIFYTGHDYQPGGRALRYSCSIGESKEKNIHLNSSTSLEQFVEFRNSRDKTLDAPKLLLPSLQINMNAGVLPPPEKNGQRFLKIPLTVQK